MSGDDVVSVDLVGDAVEPVAFPTRLLALCAASEGNPIFCSVFAPPSIVLFVIV